VDGYPVMIPLIWGADGVEVLMHMMVTWCASLGTCGIPDVCPWVLSCSPNRETLWTVSGSIWGIGTLIWVLNRSQMGLRSGVL